MSKGSSHRKKNKRVIILSGMISLFITLCMTFILLSVLLKGGLFNEKMFRQTLSVSKYYENKIEDVRESVREKLVLAGLPEDMSDDVITITAITIDANKKIKSGRNDITHELSDSTKQFGDMLRENIYEYFGETGVPITDEIKKSVELIVTEIVKDYNTHMTLLFARMYNDFHDKYAHIFDIVICVSAAVLIICSVVAVLLHSRKYRGLRYVGYGILAGLIVTEIIALIMEMKLRNMLPDNKTEYYKFVNTFIDKSFSQGIYMCFAGVLLFSLVSLMTYYLKKQVI